MTVFYLDSSVAARILLGHSQAAQQWFDRSTADAANLVISSRLLKTELTRVLRREEGDVVERDQLLDYIGMIPLDTSILIDAEAISPAIKTLDAIHLASAIRAGSDDLLVATHDVSMSTVATMMGLAVLDPVTDDPLRGTVVSTD